MSIRLISAGGSFAAACSELHNQCFEGKHAWNERAFAALFKSGAEAWIAFFEDEPAGMALARDTEGEGELLTICVLEEFRGKGIGKALLGAVCEKIPTVFLEVETTNTEAIHLYKNLGFKKCGLRKDYYAKGRDASVMRREIRSWSNLKFITK